MTHIILAVLSYIGAMLFVLWVFHHAVKAHPPAPQRPDTDPDSAEYWPPDPIVSQIAGHIKDGVERGVILTEPPEGYMQKFFEADDADCVLPELRRLDPRRFTPLDTEDYRVLALFSLWGGRVSKQGIAQLLRDKVDIGKFTADRAARALAAIEAGKLMLERVNSLLKERGEEDVNVTLTHRGYGIYRLVLLRGGRRGNSILTNEMGLNAFVSAVIEATENLRAPLKGSFLGAAGGSTDVFEQGPLTSDDGGEGSD